MKPPKELYSFTCSTNLDCKVIVKYSITFPDPDEKTEEKSLKRGDSYFFKEIKNSDVDIYQILEVRIDAEGKSKLFKAPFVLKPVWNASYEVLIENGEIQFKQK